MLMGGLHLVHLPLSSCAPTLQAAVSPLSLDSLITGAWDIKGIPAVTKPILVRAALVGLTVLRQLLQQKPIRNGEHRQRL